MEHVRAVNVSYGGGQRTRTDRGAWPRTRLMTLLLCVLVAGAAFGLRATHLAASWDIHVDEITYLRISENVAEHLRVELYGEPFYLHPPAYFFLQAGFLKLLAPEGDTVSQIYLMRYLNVGLAALSAVLIFLIGARVAGRWAGVGAALMFALEPFAVRINSQTLLETSATFWVLVGFALLTHHVARPRVGWRSRGVVILLAGAAFGLALLTKEKVALVTLLPLLLCFVLGRPLSRLTAFWTATVALLTYAVYPLTVLWVGDGAPFAEAKFSGLARFVGAVKITGFKRDGGPSFVDALFANFAAYGVAYALVGTGLLALLVLFRYPNRPRSLLATWLVSAYAMLSFSVVFGTLEEQFFYYLIIPSMIATAAAAALLLRATELRSTYMVLYAGFAVLAATFVGWTSKVWYDIHLVPSNGNERMLDYLQANVPPGSRISTTTEESQFLVEGYRTGIWTTPEVLALNGAQYVVLSTRQTENGYGFATPELSAWLGANGVRVFSAPSRTYGELILYRLADAAPRTPAQMVSARTGSARPVEARTGAAGTDAARTDAAGTVTAAPDSAATSAGARAAEVNTADVGAAEGDTTTPQEVVLEALRRAQLDPDPSAELVGSRARAARLTQTLRAAAAADGTPTAQSLARLGDVRRDLQTTQDSVARLTGAVGTYKVRPGDSLSGIALAYYGSARRWPEIAAANAFLEDPDRLVVDMVLVIP